MTAKDILKQSYDMERMVSMAYLQDLTDADLMQRPCPGGNHIKWQLGHLITAEHQMLEKIAPGTMPPLPAGFAERYKKETSVIDDPQAFDSKETLLAQAQAQREGTLQALASITEADFGKDSGIPYAPTVAKVFGLQGSHWLMHAGQWAVVRRQLGRPPLF